jgi:flavin reductase (DIM6/NTAB) family NADH-FMN oxidoreductase RutF
MANAAATILGQLDRELWIVTAAAGPRRGGLVATFVSSASIVPELPRVLVGLARQHHTWELIEASNAFALHLIGEQQLDWVWNFGGRSGRTTDKFAGLSVQTDSTGAPILTDAAAWLECRVEARLDTGDRTVYLAEVLNGKKLTIVPPLTAHRMVELAPPERLRELKDGLEHDGAVDAAAIRAWRQQRGV